MNMVIDDNKIKDILTRGVGEFIDPEGSFVKKLKENPEKIVIKFGVDPTRPDIHLGHAVILHKLRKLQDMGCKIIFLIGDYTAQIGDPTGKSKVRPEIDQMEVEQNLKTYITQVGKILDVSFDEKGSILDTDIFTWIRNSDWFTAITDITAPQGSTLEWNQNSSNVVKNIDANSSVGKALIFEKTRMQKKDLFVITLRSFLWTLKHITHNQIIKRDLFDDRLKNNKDLYLHELMYPVLQGIDSFAINHVYGSCDLEVGGTDQTFNMLMGREVMKINKKTPQAVLSFKILAGLDGKEKMSKSLDNYIAITDTPEDMYGKVMSIPDSAIVSYFELCTFTPIDEVLNIKKGLEENTIHPKEIKMQLAKQIVSIYHGEEKSNIAEGVFINTFQKGEIPEDMIGVSLSEGETLVDLMLKIDFVSSKSDYRRLVEEGAITELNQDKKIEDSNFKPEVGMKFRVGKKRFFKVI